MTDPSTILASFTIGKTTPTQISPIIGGHINKSFLVLTETEGFVLQRINESVFPDVSKLMENFCRVTGHLRAKGFITLESLQTVHGKDFHLDTHGHAWRLCRRLENTLMASIPATSQQVKNAAKAYGYFTRSLEDLPKPRLHEIIPGFHDTRKRMDEFLLAVEANPRNRIQNAATEIEFIIERREWCEIIPRAMADGVIPERIVHNDAKLDNVLFDIQTGEVASVIDLDTVMPGSILHDFGDLIRSAASSAREDEPDISKIAINKHFIDAITNGFLESCGAIITQGERELLPMAGKLVTYEQAIRFLTDYILGDHYYKTHHPNQNLDRARNQLRLVELLEENT